MKRLTISDEELESKCNILLEALINIDTMLRDVIDKSVEQVTNEEFEFVVSQMDSFRTLTKWLTSEAVTRNKRDDNCGLLVQKICNINDRIWTRLHILSHLLKHTT